MTKGADSTTRVWQRCPAGMFFGRMTLQNPMWSDASYGEQLAVSEGMFNKTLENPLVYAGRPVVRSRTIPQGARKTTQVPGGADLAESTDGCSFNFAGVVPFIMEDYHTATTSVNPQNGVVTRHGTNDRRTLFVSSFTTAPTPGDTLTQAVSGATMLVTQVKLLDAVQTAAVSRAHYTLYNMVTGVDLHTGTWDTTNNVTSNNLSGSVMAPTPVVPDIISDCDELISNVEVQTAALNAMQPTDPDYELIHVMRRGVTMCFCDDANGAIGVGTPLTWCDFGEHLVAANYHGVADTAIPVNPDNIIAVAMQAHSGGATEELLKIYLFADCPIVYFTGGVSETPGDQGTQPQ